MITCYGHGGIREEIPELAGSATLRAVLGHIGGKPVRGRPKAANPKEAVSLRLSPKVLKHFRAGGRGWQTRINAVQGALVARVKTPVKRLRWRR